MKKYTQTATKVFVALAIVCLLMVIAGIAVIVSAHEQHNLILFLMGLGIPFAILFLTVFLACARNNILMDDEKIVFPVTRTPKLSRKKNVVLFDDIKNLRITYQKGTDRHIGFFLAVLLHESGTKPTCFYTFTLKNGLEFTETLYSYGKKQEQEILTRLKEKIQ